MTLTDYGNKRSEMYSERKTLGQKYFHLHGTSSRGLFPFEYKTLSIVDSKEMTHCVNYD